MMRTVYDIDGKPVTLNPIDARQRVSVGLAWATAEDADLARASRAAVAYRLMAPAAAKGDDLTVVELRARLKADAIDFPSTADKATLVALFDANQLPGAGG